MVFVDDEKCNHEESAGYSDSFKYKHLFNLLSRILIFYAIITSTMNSLHRGQVLPDAAPPADLSQS